MSPIGGPHILGRPCHHVCETRLDLLVAAGAAQHLLRRAAADGADRVLLAVELRVLLAAGRRARCAGFDPASVLARHGSATQADVTCRLSQLAAMTVDEDVDR